LRLARSISLLLVAGLHAEIIDRIAVSVGNQAVTTSDIDREIRVTALLNRSQPDFSPAARRATADRMVEQRDSPRAREQPLSGAAGFRNRSHPGKIQERQFRER